MTTFGICLALFLAAEAEPNPGTSLGITTVVMEQNMTFREQADPSELQLDNQKILEHRQRERSEKTRSGLTPRETEELSALETMELNNGEQLLRAQKENFNNKEVALHITWHLDFAAAKYRCEVKDQRDLTAIAARLNLDNVGKTNLDRSFIIIADQDKMVRIKTEPNGKKTASISHPMTNEQMKYALFTIGLIAPGDKKFRAIADPNGIPKTAEHWEGDRKVLDIKYGEIATVNGYTISQKTLRTGHGLYGPREEIIRVERLEINSGPINPDLFKVPEETKILLDQRLLKQ